MSFPNPYYPAYSPGMGSRPRLQSMHPFHQLAAGTNMNGAWSAGGGSGQSGYGPEPADYDYHSGPPAQVPSGGSHSYHAPTGTGYGVPSPQHPPAHPPVHPPVQPPVSNDGGKSKGGGFKKGFGGSASTISALTLLSFLFFVNLLQGCIKDHMDYMNPTVMVMTADIRRNRFNKMGEMNSREQSSGSSSTASFSSNAATGANIVMQPADMVAAAAANSAAVMEAMKPMVNLQSPYSGITGSINRPPEAAPARPPQQPPQVPAVTHYQPHNPEPEVHYQRPHYDPHQPDVYEHHQHHQQQPPPPPPQPVVPQYHPQQQPQAQHYQPPPSYTNHSTMQQPPIYMGTPMDHYNSPNNDHHSNQPLPSLYTTPRNPFYEHQHPPSYFNKGDPGPPVQYMGDNEHKVPHNYDTSSPSQEQPHNVQGPVPWSSHSSSSVVSGPFRRATIVSVSPTIKWISVPSNVDDHTDFDTQEVSETNRNYRYSGSSNNRKYQ